MPFIEAGSLPETEKRPGWWGRIFSSDSMTFAHWRFEAGAAIHEHGHAQEEVWHVVDGDLEITIAGVTWRAGPSSVAIVPANTPRAVVAITDGKAIVADYPLRPGF